MSQNKKNTVLLGLCVAGLSFAMPAAAQVTLPTTSPVRTGSSACLAINSLILPELATVSAEWLVAGASRPAPSGADATPALASHCRVSATVAPSIRIEVWLPAAEAWNGRFLGLGGTAAGGTLNLTGMAAALNAGYATASTDNGHRPDDYSWPDNDRQLRDFAYRAIYEMTAHARILVADFYGRPADYRYFSGCALGGRQGLVEAERFPGDYDGIVAGSPSPGFVEAAVLQFWLQAAAAPGAGPPAPLPESLALADAEPVTRDAAGWIDIPAGDLGTFRNRGGRLIVYQGWNDASSPPEATIAWYEAVAVAAAAAQTAGGPAAGVGEFARLFMAPGTALCGSEPMSTQLQSAIEDWVERGIAPDRIETVVRDAESSARPGLLCPYPREARNRATGSNNPSTDYICAN